MSNYVLRPMTLDDLDAVTALDARAFGPAGWNRRYFEGELTESKISIFCVLCEAIFETGGADESGRIIGYFGVWHIVEQLHLCTFAVDPDAQGRGLGALLLQCVFRLAQRLHCDTIQLEVRESNTVARSLYRTRGFVEQEVRRRLYDHPVEDGILMSSATPTAIAPVGALLLHWDDRGGASEERWR